MKDRTLDWFDGEIMERIKNCDKLLKIYKKSKLEIDHQIYREAKAAASNLIKSKKFTILNKRTLKTLVTRKKFGEL